MNCKLTRWMVRKVHARKFIVRFVLLSSTPATLTVRPRTIVARTATTGVGRRTATTTRTT